MIVSFLVSLLQLVRVIQEPEFNQIVLFSEFFARGRHVCRPAFCNDGIYIRICSLHPILPISQQDAGHDNSTICLCISLLFMVSCAIHYVLFSGNYWLVSSLLSHNYLHGQQLKVAGTFIILREGT